MGHAIIFGILKISIDKLVIFIGHIKYTGGRRCIVRRVA
jgi:hypothetical protein